MGWLHGWNTFKSIFAERTKNWENTVEDNHVVKNCKSVCLKRCFKGNPAFNGTLWTVWEQTVTIPDGTTEVVRYIGCDLLQCTNGQWGYKNMDESVHPYYYNCPLSYLDLVPVACKEWRDQVILYHEERKKNKTLVSQID